MKNKDKTSVPFTSYEKFVIAIIAILQFTIILDFMVLSPLGAILMPSMNISTSQFGSVVSMYAFFAGISGFIAAGFMDKFDRKKMLLFFYIGFIVGTLLCGIANNYYFLLFARIFTGIFGGVIGSIGFAIITDLFRMEVRGRVMGFVQIAFSASQVLGIPIALLLAGWFDWHAPFLLIVGLSIIICLVIWFKFKPVTGHLHGRVDKNAFLHLWHTLSNSFYLRGFLATVLLATGGFMIMPFSSAFLVNNIMIKQDHLYIIFFITGLLSIFTGPFIGRFSDKLGKYNLFLTGTLLTIGMLIYYTNMGPTPMWGIILVNSVLWIGISSRIITSSALISGVPELKDRGAYMSINSSMQQLSGGLASMLAGQIVHQATKTSPLENFNIVGYVTVGTMVFTIIMMYFINRQVSKKLHVAHA